MYMFQRGFTQRTLDKYEVGYDPVAEAVTFPVRASDGRLRFISKRFVSRKGFLNESGIDKKDIVYGLYYIKQSPKKITEIYLNESATDTMSCYQGKLPAGAILGRILFKEQVKELIKAGIKTVNLFLDNDLHGLDATIKAYELIARMSPIVVNVVIYPGGHYGIHGFNDMVFKDANDLLKAGNLGAIKVVPYEYFISKVDIKQYEKKMNELRAKIKNNS